MERAVAAVKLARSLVGDVEFYAEDAGRAEPAFLYQMVEAAIEAGATVVNIPDTTGYTYPEEFGALDRRAVSSTSTASATCVVSVHCHNDLGMATANALAGVLRRSAADRVHRQRHRRARGQHVARGGRDGAAPAPRRYFGADTTINTKEIMRISRLVSNITGIVVQPNKAIVGANAFAHSSGIHQDGVLKERTTYEIIDPADVGVAGSSDRAHRPQRPPRAEAPPRRARLRRSPRPSFERVYAAFLDLADQKKEVFDEDLEALVGESERTSEEVYHLEQVHVTCGDPGIPTATVELIGPDGRAHGRRRARHRSGRRRLQGDQPDRAACRPSSSSSSVKAVTAGIDAQGEVTIRVAERGRPRLHRPRLAHRHHRGVAPRRTSTRSTASSRA